MRTTIRLADDLLREVKRLAADSGSTFTAIVEEALRETVARAHRRPSRRKIRLKTSRGAFRSAVDLDHSAELRELMDGVDASS